MSLNGACDTIMATAEIVLSTEFRVLRKYEEINRKDENAIEPLRLRVRRDRENSSGL